VKDRWLIVAPDGRYVYLVSFWTDPPRAEAHCSDEPSEVFPFVRAAQIRRQLRDCGQPGFRLVPCPPEL
jgi:hypothetical protein